MLLQGLLACSVLYLASASDQEDNLQRLDIGSMAGELLGRATSSSQVLSLNLSNLGILLLLKTLIFGAFYLGGDKYHKARSLENDEIISEQEILLILSYLMGDVDNNYSCLYRVACQDPSKSKQYLAAAKFLVKTAKLFESVIPFDNKYDKLVEELQDSVNFGTRYGTCDKKYSCMKKTEENAAKDNSTSD